LTVLPDRIASRALLIGAATFGPGLPAIPEAAATVTDLAERLGDVLDRSAVLPRIDPADRSAVLAPLHTASADARDLMLFCYTGHGVLDADGRLCLALPSTVDHPHQARHTSLPLDEVVAAVSRSRARHRVLLLDCCYSARALDEAGAADLHILVSADRTELAHSDGPSGGRHTTFGRELLRLIDEGVPDGPRWLSLDLVFRQLDLLLAAQGLPRPRQRTVDRTADLAIARNRAHGTASTPRGLRYRAYVAEQTGRTGDPARAAQLFAGIVADAPQVTAYRRGYANWLGEAGDPAAAVAMLGELADGLPPGPDRDHARASRAYWAARRVPG
jgi:hypothetical protein